MVSRLEGCALAGSDASKISQVPQVRGGREGVPIQSSLLWSLHRPSGFHPGHGSCFSNPSQVRGSVTSLSGRLVNSGLLLGAGSPCSGDSIAALQDFGNRRQLGEVTAGSNAADGLSRSHFGLNLLQGFSCPEESRVNLFQGFSCPKESREASLNWRHILVLHKTACDILAGAFRRAVIHDPAGPGRRLRRSFQFTLRKYWDHVDQTVLVEWTQEIRQDLDWWLDRDRLERGVALEQVSSQLDLWSDASDVGWGGTSGRRGCFRPLGSGRIRRLHQSQGALSHREGSSLVRSSNLRLISGDFRGQRYGGALSQESGRNSLSASEFHRSEDFTVGGVSSRSVDSPIHHGASQCSSGFVVSAEPNPGFGMDSEARGFLGALQEVADLLSRPNQILGLEWTLKLEVF